MPRQSLYKQVDQNLWVYKPNGNIDVSASNEMARVYMGWMDNTPPPTAYFCPQLWPNLTMERAMQASPSGQRWLVNQVNAAGIGWAGNNPYGVGCIKPFPF